MITTRITVRLTSDEVAKAKSLLGGNGAGCENIGELVRLLLHREYNRRHGLKKPKSRDWQSAFRLPPTGPKRPKPIVASEADDTQPINTNP